MRQCDPTAHNVLEHYRLPGLTGLTALGNRGGFSGARLWHGKSLAGDFCLRAWPEGTDHTVLLAIHLLMQKANEYGLDFVPRVHRTSQGGTCLAHGGKVWDVTSWMPGVANFHEYPSKARLVSTCISLAHLHSAWADKNPQRGPCRAVVRRIDRLRHWQDLTCSGWKPDFDNPPAAPWHFWGRRAWSVLERRISDLPGRLLPWLEVSLPLQPCLCDIWHDHVLFTGDKVTGIVDYGSVKIDHAAVDLARLLGSLVEDEEPLRRAGLEAYAQIHDMSDLTQRLIEVLDITGTVLGAANWLMWLYHDRRTFSDQQGVAQRLASLVQRMERW